MLAGTEIPGVGEEGDYNFFLYVTLYTVTTTISKFFGPLLYDVGNVRLVGTLCVWSTSQPDAAVRFGCKRESLPC